jgi:DNA-binding MarR family transcriptional regulator
MPTTPTADEPVPDENLVDALVQSAFATMAVLTRVAAEHDLSLTQLRVLGILRDRRVRMTELADFLGLEKSTMTGLVARAEKRGLLQRAPNAEDGRAVDVFVTDSGRNLAERVAVRVGRELQPATEALAPGERRRLAADLQRTLSPGPVRR